MEWMDQMIEMFKKEIKYYPVNQDITYDFEPLVKENMFIGKEKDTKEIPEYESSKDIIPGLVWEGHPDAVACYNKTWEICFKNMKKPTKEDGMVSNYIDTAMNENLFMWDSSFITMFGKYCTRVFNAQKTLDNIYANQHYDGFMSREINEPGKGDRFHRFDPVSTGPNIMPWAEWEYYEITGDLERIKAVFPPLLAYYIWLKKNHTWPDGSYWSSGWGCGMDNQPRLQPGYNVMFSHGHQIWADACFQQILSARILIRMAKLIGREKDTEILKEEIDNLTKLVNEKLWDDKTSFYYDLWRNGELNKVKSIGAYWALLAGVVPEDKLDSFIAHLENEKEFKRPHRVPTLSADHPLYDGEKGQYWRGGVWAPTNYMVLKGLEKCGYHKLTYEIALNHVHNVISVFNKTGTVWENYAPETENQGFPAKEDFVGWTGLSPIAIMIEYVFGIHRVPGSRKIVWRINCQEAHGVKRYPLGNDDYANLLCPEHRPDQKPEITVEATIPVTVEVIWPDGAVNTVHSRNITA